MRIIHTIRWEGFVYVMQSPSAHWTDVVFFEIPNNLAIRNGVEPILNTRIKLTIVWTVLRFYKDNSRKVVTLYAN